MKPVDRLQFMTTATSTSTVSVTGSVVGARTPAQAIADGDLALGESIALAIEMGSVYEISEFTLTSTTLLTRVQVLGSSNGGAAAVFPAGEKEALCTAPAKYLKGARPADLPALGTPLDSDLVVASRNNVLGTYLASAFKTWAQAGGAGTIDNAPILTSPNATAIGPTAASGGVTTNETGGTLYWLFSTSSSATAAAVKAGQSKAVTASGAQTVTGSGLTAATPYYLHLLHRDSANQDSAVSTSAQFMTQAAAAATMASLYTISAAPAAYGAPATSATFSGTGTIATNKYFGTPQPDKVKIVKTADATQYPADNAWVGFWTRVASGAPAPTPETLPASQKFSGGAWPTAIRYDSNGGTGSDTVPNSVRSLTYANEASFPGTFWISSSPGLFGGGIAGDYYYVAGAPDGSCLINPNKITVA